MKINIRLLLSLSLMSGILFGFAPKGDITSKNASLFYHGVQIYTYSDFDLIYIVNPARIDKEEYQQAMSKFRQNGFDLGFSESYKEEALEQLKISLGSNWNKVSATYQIEELRKKQYIIFIGANTQTGDVTVVSRKPE